MKIDADEILSDILKLGIEINSIVLAPYLSCVINIKFEVVNTGIGLFAHAHIEGEKVVVILHDIFFFEEDCKKIFIEKVENWIKQNPFLIEFMKGKIKLTEFS